MTRKSRPLSEQLRRCIEQSDVSAYRICKDCGIDKAAMSRFLAGKSGLSLRAIDTVTDYLGLELTSKDKPKRG